MTHAFDRPASHVGSLRLSQNENTVGCSPRVLEAVQAVTRKEVALYPDYTAATAAVATRLGVSPEQVQLTNGLDEGILLVSLVALKRDEPEPPEVIIVVPAFEMYGIYAQATGARIVEVAYDREFTFPTERVLAAITPRTRLVWLNTPNNPSGQIIPRAEILEIVSRARSAYVVVDEAYADFAGVTRVESSPFELFPNLIVGRTFAKAYGMAGLRAGALVAAPSTLAPIREIVPPYSLNVCAAAAIPAACADTEYYAWYLDQVRESKALLYATFDRLSFPYWPSATNFVLARFGDDAPRIVAGLAARQVLVRDRSKDPACPGCVRITAGIVEHTRTCIRALEEVV
jgi:histidinol-phosphate aminotransferase